MNQKTVLSEKVKGSFLGLAIGDALGMPYEKLKHTDIMALTGGDVSNYVAPNDKHFLKGVLSAGDITDDTQLSLVIAKSLAECRGFKIEDCIARHIIAMDESTFGWGKGTVGAINRLKDGGDYRTSGTPNGAGNGVAMKIAPFGCMMAVSYFSYGDRQRWHFMENVFDLALMTHRSAMAVASGWVQANMIKQCFLSYEGQEWLEESFLVQAITACTEGESMNAGIDDIKERLVDRLIDILYNKTYKMEVSELATYYGKQPFYVYDSLPLSYACFLKSPHSIEAVYNAIRAGGDTDTNASMVGALLGALNGPDVFPRHLIEGLNKSVYDKVMSVAYEFCEKFVDILSLRL